LQLLAFLPFKLNFHTFGSCNICLAFERDIALLYTPGLASWLDGCGEWGREKKWRYLNGVYLVVYHVDEKKQKKKKQSS
jgi:hypothetical protein